MGFASSLVGPVPGSRGGSLAPGRLLLSGAEFWVDAALSGRSGGKLLNLGTGGTALDATFGSTTGSDANDPADLPWAGMNYLYMTGTGNDNLSVPSSAALNALTGDIDIISLVFLDAWVPAAGNGLAGRDAGDPNRAWVARIEATTGRPSLRWYPTGSAASIVSAVATAAPTASNGQWLWLRTTLDVDNGASGNTTTFYTAPFTGSATLPTTWTPLGSPVVQAGVTSLPSVTANLTIGNNAGALLAGGVARTVVRNGIDGPIVADVDCTRGIASGGQTTFTEFSVNAALATITRGTSGRKAVAVVRPTLLLGTDDYLEVANSALVDFNATDSFTALAVVRSFNTPANNGRLIQKGTPTDPRWFIFETSTFATGIQVTDTVNTTTPSTAVGATVGNVTVAAATVNRTSQLATAYVNNTPSTSSSTSLVGSMSNTAVMRIGANPGTVANPWDGELLAAATFKNRVLTAADIAAIVSYYGAS